MRLREFLTVQSKDNQSLQEWHQTKTDNVLGDYEPKEECDWCGEELGSDAIVNYFGETLCDHCWDEYVNSEKGSLEYFVDLAINPDITADDIDFYLPSQRKKFRDAWEKYKDKTVLGDRLIKAINLKATLKGL